VLEIASLAACWKSRIRPPLGVLALSTCALQDGMVAKVVLLAVGRPPTVVKPMRLAGLGKIFLVWRFQASKIAALGVEKLGVNFLDPCFACSGDDDEDGDECGDDRDGEVFKEDDGEKMSLRCYPASPSRAGMHGACSIHL